MYRRVLHGFVALVVWALAGAAAAEVVRVEVLERAPFLDGRGFGAVGAYERLRGRLTFAVDPAAPGNATIVDLKYAPRDADGRVSFAADFLLLRPIDPARANGRLLYEVNNRGGIGMIGLFNDARGGNALDTEAHAGNGFLFEQGYTLLSTGWTWDVPPGDGRLRADLPTIRVEGRAVTGKVNGEIAVTRPTPSAPHIGMLSVGYPPVEEEAATAVLTVRERADAPRTVVPRAAWRFGRLVGETFYADPAWITLEGGFKPGAIYTLTYTAREPRVVGLGLVAIRDAIAFFRGADADAHGTPNPLRAGGAPAPQAVIAFGNSQSGRVLAAMLELGLMADGRGQPVIDGALLNVAGGGKGSFNYRFAQASRHFSPDVEMDFPTDWFPFSTAASTDPVTGQTASLLDRGSAAAIPKLFFVNTSAEYWARAASLVHTTVDAAADLPPADIARLYFIAGGQHTPASSGERRNFSACRNPLDYRPLMRALLLQLDAWTTLDRAPAPTAVPLLSQDQLGSLVRYSELFPQIPAARLPSRYLEPPRLDFGPRFTAEGIADIVPPTAGAAFATRVPLPDADGLDHGGLRMPEIVAPLGTYTGWNLQNADTGAPDRLGRWDGSFFPFARTENERIAMRDPRPSIAERYASREAYVEAVAAATLSLAGQELILSADVNPTIERAGRLYDRIMARDPADESCDYLKENRN
ncbi:MAG: alpha/beta hydrolase domain-containing protein [Rhodospirillaceae bacterium]|nr:alpha/beta hydrolase domain-containing protein [Rhodospirillaceae bacterium]